MKGSRWWVAFGVAAALIGLLALRGSGGEAELPTLLLLPVPRRPAAAHIASNAQVTRTSAGLWITYTEDGEGNPLGGSDFAPDITTGDMWFRHGAGLLTELSAAGEWTTYSAEDFGYEPPRQIMAVAVDEGGNTWVGMCVPWLPSTPQTEGGVVMIAPDGSWTDYTDQFDRCIQEVLADRAGNKWFFERDSITRFDGETWQMYSPLPDYVIEQHYEEILETIDRGYREWYVEAPDRVWCFNWLIGRGVNVYDGSKWTTYTPADGLAYEVVAHMSVDHNSHKWFSTASGVSMLDDGGTLSKDDDVWTTFNMGGLDIAVDEEGKVWIAIRDLMTFEGRGVTVWNGNEWHIYDTTNSGLFHDQINDILVDGEDVKWGSPGISVVTTRCSGIQRQNGMWYNRPTSHK